MVSKASQLLNKRLLRFLVNRLKWKDFNPIQDEAIPIILEGKDTLVIAPTASGKTEAVLLPIFSEILDKHYEPLSVLYVAPLKALINDMNDRIDFWGKHFNLETVKWHGDVGKPIKDKFFKNPSDFLLITPESLEVIFMNRSDEEKRHVFKNLKYVVVDEIHYFAESDRGIQLNSLLNRIDKYCEKKPTRLGLSATVGNPSSVSKWLNYEDSVKIVKNTDSRVLEYRIWNPKSISNTLKRLQKYKDKKILIFVPSRRDAENFFAFLKQKGFSNIFIHHSSIDKDTREESEKKFKEYPAGIMVSTSTLELGIDIGDIDLVVNINPPYSVNSFLQRIGRGGRRSKVQRTVIVADKMEVIVSLADLILAEDGFVEDIQIPTNSKDIFFHQILSSIFEKGKVDYKELYYDLTSSYVFSDITKREYLNMLSYMEEQEFIYINDKYLTLAYTFEEKFGEKNFSTFYAVFCPSQEYVVKDGDKEIGSIDAGYVSVLNVHDSFILGGKYWKITKIDDKHHAVYVFPDYTKDSNVPTWNSDGPPLGYEISRKVYDILLNDYDHNLTKYLDSNSKDTLQLAKTKALESSFAKGIIPVEFNVGENKIYIFTFAGDKANSLLVTLFTFYYDLFDIRITPFYASFKIRGDYEFTDIEEVIYGAEKVLNSSDIYELIYNNTKKFYKNKFINYLPPEDEVQLKMALLYDIDNLIKVINENTLVLVDNVDFDKWFPTEEEPED